jgi:hypothetical protein
MKIMKIAAAAVLVSSAVIGSFAFVNSKKLAGTDFYYFSGTDRQRIEYGHTSETDLKERSPESNSGADFKDVNNWTTSLQQYTSTTDMSKYIGKINFTIDEVNPPNGGSDGDLTLSEALTALYNQYNNAQAMPASFTVGTCVISVEAATAAH